MGTLTEATQATQGLRVGLTCDAGTALGEPEEMREPKVAGCVSSQPNRGGLVKGVGRQLGFWKCVPKRVMGLWKS